MHILVTRPEADAAELKAALEAQGHEVTVEPLLTIAALPIGADDLAGARGVIATSRNGLRALAGSEALARAVQLPIFVVGPSTSKLAHDLGFQRVIAGEGSAADLVPLILNTKIGEDGPLVHVSGEDVAFDLAETLGRHGTKVRRVIAYRAIPAQSLGPQMVRAIAHGRLEAVILMSPRTARTFAELVDKAGLKESARRLAYICLSQNVASTLDGLAPIRVNIAVRPILPAILDAVARVATHSSGV